MINLIKKFVLIVFTVIISTGSVFAASWKSFPLNVYIAPHPDYTYAKNAFTSWERWTGKSLFRFINDAGSANITVGFEENLNIENAIGLTHRRVMHSTGEMLHADITIRLKSIRTAKRHNGRQTFLITAHEVGHALGLEHSNDPMDLMYPNYRDITTLSRNDKNAFKALYGD